MAKSQGIAVQGLKELNDKLLRMEKATAIKSLRSAAVAATSPVVKEMKAAAPKGTRAHKTYKGRLVAPGFLSRSVKRMTRIDKKTGKMTLTIGVKKEAFYGVSFLDEGKQVTQRRIKGKRVPIKPYRIPAHRWFKRRFEKSSPKIVADFKLKLRAKIEAQT